MGRRQSRSLSFLLGDRRLRRRREEPALSPARPSFPFASDDLLGLRCKGNGRIFARRCKVGLSRVRVSFSGGDCKVEVAPPEWNKVLQLVLYLTIFCFVGGDELGESFLTGFGDRVGARDLDGACTRVSFPADVRWPPVLLVLWSSVGGWSDGGSDVGVGVGESVARSGGGPWRIKFLLIVSGGICVEGDWYLVMVEEAVVHGLGVLII
jgi:hypothetical protein